MISPIDIFSAIGQKGCSDVATSLQMQGLLDIGSRDFKIPIYEIAYIKILPDRHCSYICSSMQEYSLVKMLAKYCGTVSIALNILDMDLLTLIGMVAAFTPKTGANFFIKSNLSNLINNTEALAQMMTNQEGIENALMILQMGLPGTGNIVGAASEILDRIFNMLVENISNDCKNSHINIYPFEKLPEYYNELKQTGELYEMGRLRELSGAITI